MPSCLKSSPTRTATETRVGSSPRRPAEIPTTARSAGTSTSGAFVKVQDSVKGGSGGGGGGGGWQLAANVVRTAMAANSAERFKTDMQTASLPMGNSPATRTNVNRQLKQRGQRAWRAAAPVADHEGQGGRVTLPPEYLG